MHTGLSCARATGSVQPLSRAEPNERADSNSKRDWAFPGTAIRANKMRSVLTTLGIVIGIVTVTLMGTAIEGLNRAFLKNISFIGADVCTCSGSTGSSTRTRTGCGCRSAGRLRCAQVKALERQLTMAARRCPDGRHQQSRSSIRSAVRTACMIIGTTDQFLKTSSVTVARAGFMSPRKSKAAGRCASSAREVATNLFQREIAAGEEDYHRHEQLSR